MANPLHALSIRAQLLQSQASTIFAKVCIFVTSSLFSARTYIHRKCKLDVYLL